MLSLLIRLTVSREMNVFEKFQFLHNEYFYFRLLKFLVIDSKHFFISSLEFTDYLRWVMLVMSSFRINLVNCLKVDYKSADLK